MTVEQHDRLDIVAQRGDTIALVMVEVRPWSAVDAIREDLRLKILNYAGYANSDQYREEHGDAPVEIVLSHEHEPPPEIVTMLANASADLGIPIKHISRQ